MPSLVGSEMCIRDRPHPPAHDEMRPGSSACPTIPPVPLLHTDQCTAETFDHLPPRPRPLTPASTDSRSIQNKPLRIASSGSPVLSPSVSSVTSIGYHNKPDRLCAINQTYHLLLTSHWTVNFFVTVL